MAYMSPFSTARLRLMMWYAVALLLVVIATSAVFFFLSQTSLRRHIIMGDFGYIPANLSLPEKRLVTAQVTDENRSTIISLIGIDAGLFILSLIGGYVLAGRTLSPIDRMLERQKEFIADVSHELRTPIAILQLSHELALRESDTSQEEYKQTIVQSLAQLHRLQLLTDGLIYLARGQDIPTITTISRQNLSAIVEKCIENMKILADTKAIDIEVEKREDIYAPLDKDKIAELIEIFLDNALKYTPPHGSIWIRMYHNPPYAVVEIRDSGIGIAKEHLAHIFERSYRVDKAKEGSGLGLAIAKRIIDEHHVECSVTSIPGSGTTIVLRFPSEL